MEAKMNCEHRSKHAKANPGDYLSDLPDEILCHILSFLTTKYAVRTSVLSPRWKDVYKGVPNINSSIVEIEKWNMKILQRWAKRRAKSYRRSFGPK